jgi:hypothetical protein
VERVNKILGVERVNKILGVIEGAKERPALKSARLSAMPRSRADFGVKVIFPASTLASSKSPTSMPTASRTARDIKFHSLKSSQPSPRDLVLLTPLRGLSLIFPSCRKMLLRGGNEPLAKGELK